MNRELIVVTEQIAREKGIDKEVLFEALESGLLSAFKKTTGAGAGDNVRMELDRGTGTLRVLAKKRVVAKVTDPKVELTLTEARALKADAQLDDEVEQELVPQELGRIAAQTAKQVILQRVRDAEREGIYSEFVHKEGQIVRGVVHRIEKRNVIVEMGKAEGFLPEREQIPGERINPGDRIRAYVLEVRKTAKGPQITLSRTHPGFLARLFETEIPEIAEGIVQVKAAAREAGERAKVAVASTKRDVDPIGACVGLRGTRIQVVSRELRGEKIDIVEWSADPTTFVARSLSPAKVASVTLQEPRQGSEAPVERSVLVVVPDNQLSLAIGKKGQNARLAAKLTGMRVDIKSESELEEERRREKEERAQGRSAIEEFPGVGPQLAEKLVEDGLFSPLRIVRAGLPRLLEIPGVGEKKAEKILAAAQEWLAAQAVAPPASEPQASVAGAPVAEEAGVVPDDEGTAPPA
jgi:N utilization substance protein A